MAPVECGIQGWRHHCPLGKEPSNHRDIIQLRPFTIREVDAHSQAEHGWRKPRISRSRRSWALHLQERGIVSKRCGRAVVDVDLGSVDFFEGGLSMRYSLVAGVTVVGAFLGMGTTTGGGSAETRMPSDLCCFRRLPIRLRMDCAALIVEEKKPMPFDISTSCP